MIKYYRFIGELYLYIAVPIYLEVQIMAMNPLPLTKRVNDFVINTTTFTEHHSYSAQIPHTTHTKLFPHDDVVPLHYADTIEILVCDGVFGEVVIGKERIEVQGGIVCIFIPPFIVHSTSFKKNDGYAYVMKISLENLKPFVDIKAMLMFNGYSIESIPYNIPYPEQVLGITEELIRHDDDVFARMQLLIRMFSHFQSVSDAKRPMIANTVSTGNLRQIIEWTNQNFAEPVTIEEAAKQLNFSKYYFCKFFKSATGITYWTFLNQVRMVQAAILLEEGKTATECCGDCGFDSLPYFVKLFRETHGCSTVQYRRMHEKAKQPAFDSVELLPNSISDERDA